jgi:hypothetical protein
MRISTPPLITAQKKEQVKTEKKSIIESQRVNLSKKEACGPVPISRGELASLAADFKNGLINRDEANKRLITTVINNSIGGKLGERDREQIIHYIKEFLSHDPNFEADLAKNLIDFV